MWCTVKIVEDFTEREIHENDKLSHINGKESHLFWIFIIHLKTKNQNFNRDDSLTLFIIVHYWRVISLRGLRVKMKVQTAFES